MKLKTPTTPSILSEWGPRAVKCKSCKKWGEAGVIQPYHFPDFDDPVWLHQIGCSERYYDEWRAWRATQTSSTAGSQ
jgi:hypothetical protein